jgi:UDP-MurNAc hydroxylase
LRVTGLGHAGMFVETRGGSVLCDPWVNPAFFGSWFPFPDNRGLDWERFGQADYLYISHRHKDHFDPALLQRYVSRDTTVLLPEYPTAELETDLRGLGFDNILYTRAGEEFTRDGLRIMITPLRGPGDGPIGDSALSLDDGTAVLLNQNDSHPLDVEKIRAFGEPDAYFTQFSGAIWWPMVYDLPDAAKQRFAELKRKSQSDRTLFYIDQVGSPNVFPMAGPPCFLDEELFGYNGYGTDDTSIFTDQRQFLDELAVKRPSTNGHLFLPGTVIELSGGECTVSQSLFADAEIERMFSDKWGYLRDFQAERGHEVVAEKASRAPVPADMFEQLQAWWEPLMKRAPFLCDAIGAPVRFEIGDVDLVVDFPAREVRHYAEEKVRYWYRTSADLVATNLRDGEIDWSNSLFLSLRFSAGRVGKFNEYLYTFFKCLSEERIDYVENWYSEQGDTGEDIVVGDWIVQRRCPHLRADLKKFATLDGGVLTCNLHSWQFDLASGRCLTSRGHEIRARRAGTDA